MSSVSVNVLGANVSPCECVQTGRSIVILFFFACLFVDVDFFTNTSNIVDGNQDRHNNTANRNEDDEERFQIAEEEVGIKTTLVDDFTVVVVPQYLEHASKSRWRGIGSFSFGDKVGFWFAATC